MDEGPDRNSGVGRPPIHLLIIWLLPVLVGLLIVFVRPLPSWNMEAGFGLLLGGLLIMAMRWESWHKREAPKQDDMSNVN